MARLIPGVLGCEESSADESFSMGLLEYPQYTRPAQFRNLPVPQVLLNGVHADIAVWRRRQALEITRERRPDMLESAPLTKGDRETLAQMDRADAIIARLAGQGIHAERMEMFAEAAYAKNWFRRFVPEENRKAAKKLCFSGRRHVGFLYQAFEMGYAPCETGQAASFDVFGPAVLYYNETNLAFRVSDCRNLQSLPAKCVLTAEDMSWTFAAGKNGAYYFAVPDMTVF